jgi:hypothetical protein
MMLGLLEEHFDVVYGELLQDGLVSLSDELQQRLRSIVVRELMVQLSALDAESVCDVLDNPDGEPLRATLQERICQHVLHPDVLNAVSYDPRDPVVLVHVALQALRTERGG